MVTEVTLIVSSFCDMVSHKKYSAFRCADSVGVRKSIRHKILLQS